MTHSCSPNKFVTSPQSNVFIMTSSCKKLIFRMSCQTPKLSAMSKDNLIKTSLQRSLQNIVFSCSHIDVSIISAGSLWVNCANPPRCFRKLKEICVIAFSVIDRLFPYLNIRNSFVVLQGIPCNNSSIFFTSRQKCAFWKHYQATDTFGMCLKFCPNKVSAICIYTVYCNEPVTIGCNHISIWLKLYACDICSGWLKF